MSEVSAYPYRLILYYQFAPVADPEEFCLAHKKLCQQLNVYGRVYVAAEGINGTLAGLSGQIETYMQAVRALPGFAATEFKVDELDHVPFVKLIVKVREEIVTLKTPERLDVREGGRHLSPEEWKAVLDSDEEVILIDVRNDYESKVGHFEGAICPDERNFYDFPQWLDRAGLDKSKKVLMYCTGGIRCEKFSVLMKKKGFRDVNQLHGGIINYAKTVGDAHYKGKCFVFDDRLTVPIQQGQEQPLTTCEITGVPCDTYLNCANPDCNKLFICSEEGAHQYEGCCSPECLESPRRRPFDPEQIYTPTRKWYQYFEEKR
ncbi:MAG: rhodanese-related sulfurtransferase [Candidatus Omnitrophica bacterium]|nr:rhodanese-related sulfurtransferase [Candidatus Omnitrophota bacterium]